MAPVLPPVLVSTSNRRTLPVKEAALNRGLAGLPAWKGPRRSGGRVSLRQEVANHRRDGPDRPGVVTLRDDDVRIPLRGFDELQMHRSNRLLILSKHRIQRSPTLDDVARETPYEPEIGVGIDVDPQIHQIAQRRFCKNQDSLDEDHRLWLDTYRFDCTGVL